MNRDLLTAELARAEAAAPSRFASFNEGRAARIAEIKALLAAMPAPVEPFNEDDGLARILTNQKNAERAQRAMERRGY